MKATAILPLLMLCVASCSHAPRASLRPAAGAELGNSYRLQLPAETSIRVPDEATAAQLRAVAYHELAPARAGEAAVVLAQPLQLVSPAYMAERNAAELRLIRQVVELQEEIARLRSR